MAASELKVALRITAQGAEGKKAVEDLQRALGALAREGQGAGRGVAAGLEGAERSAGSLIGTVGKLGGLLAALGGGLALGAGITALAQAGVAFNVAIEDGVTGIASLISAQANLADAQGRTLQGVEAYRAAVALSEQEMQALRRAGLQTAATTTQLAEAYRAALGPSLAAGITDLEQVRAITIGITQAAAAMGVPMDQLRQEIASILSGNISNDSVVASTLGLTNEMVAGWKEQGRLVQELTARLAPFQTAAAEAANNWTVVKGNAQEAFDTIAGEITGGGLDAVKTAIQQALANAFNLDTLGVSAQFAGLVAAARDVGTAIGESIGGGLTGAVQLAADFSAWLDEHRVAIDGIREGLADVLLALSEAVGVIAELFGAVLGALTDTVVESGAWEVTLKAIAVVVAGIADGVRLIGGAVLYAGGLIVELLQVPLQVVLGLAREIVGVFDADMAAAIGRSAEQIDQLGDRMRQAGRDMLAPFAEGQSAVQKLFAPQSTAPSAAQFAKLHEVEEQKVNRALITGVKHAAAQAGEKKKAARAAQEHALSEEQVTRQLLAARIELARLQGTLTPDLARAGVAQQYDDLVKALQKRGRTADVALITQVIDVKAAQQQFDALTARWEQTTATLRNTEDSAQVARDAGLTGELGMRERIVDANAQAAAQLQTLLPQMQALAAAIGPDAVATVGQYAVQLQRVGLAADKTAQIAGRLREDFTGAFSGFLQRLPDVIAGTQSLGDALRSLVADFARAIQRELSDRLASSLIGAIFSGGRGGDLLSGLASLIGGFAGGGIVRGPGSGTSDSILARLSDGEYVIRAAAVRHWGLGFLDQINGLAARPREAAFASGGPVAGLPAAQAPVINLRNINVLDPSVIEGYLSSPAGETVVFNVLARRPELLRGLSA